jgi:DNA-binding response OmpR family regulator
MPIRHRMATPASPLVLVVEDDHGVRRPLEKFLQMHDFKVVTAETADDAIDAIHQHRPIAAIIDLRLARGSGRDVVVSMPAGTPVIIFSGVPSESAELERLRPRTRLVQKPYSLTMLVEALRDMISSAKLPTD